MRITLITLFISQFHLNAISQFRFESEAEWKYAYEMIYQADRGNCKTAYMMFDSLQRIENFRHSNSYVAIAQCLQKDQKPEKADSIINIGRLNGTFTKFYDESKITHPDIKERFILMYLEDQGSWSIKNEFIIDPGVKQSLKDAGIDLTSMTNKIRRLPGRELHKLHIKELNQIVEEYGFPNYEMVGYQAMQGVKLVILHSKLEILEKYETEFKQFFGMKRLAYLIDKQRVAKKEKQLYGTQGDFDANKNLVFYPIEDEANVNKRRMEAGMEPIEQYAKILGVKNYEIPVHNNK